MRQYTKQVEAHLNVIMDRFDEFVPILRDMVTSLVDILAPNLAVMMKHLDEVMPYSGQSVVIIQYTKVGSYSNTLQKLKRIPRQGQSTLLHS